MPDFGYAGEILKVDLSDGSVVSEPTSAYADRFLGGHGIAAKLYWDMVPPRAKAYGPENCLIYASGPVAGFTRFAGFRWKICGKSILGDLESFNYCNLGDKWGAFLKFAGYDALAVQGKAEKPVIILIDNGRVKFKDATSLRGKLTFDIVDELKEEYGQDVAILTIGPAGDRLLNYAVVYADEGASGSGGLAAVMGSKNLKAIIVTPGSNRPKAAHKERLQKLADEFRGLRQPGNNMSLMWEVSGLTRNKACYGCGIGCGRQVYSLDGHRCYKSLCEASIFYSWAVKKYSGKADEARLMATRLCDGYGIDTSVMHGMIEWLNACYERGLITEKQTGLPLKEIGSPEFIEKLVGMIARQEGFGEVLARGTIAAAREIGTEAEDLLHRYIATRGSETKDYDPRLMITTSLLYATEPRRPIQQLHGVCSLVMAWLGMGDTAKPGESFMIKNFRKVAEKFWGSKIAADFSTLEGKPLAAKVIQDRTFVKESLVLCDLTWPVMVVRGGVGDSTLESRLYSAITGKETDEQELNRVGERIFNLQRAILLRQGWRGREDDQLLDYYYKAPLEKGEIFWNEDGLMPGQDGKIISKVGAVVDRDDFEKMKSEYYELRGWESESGLPTKSKLVELQLQDVASDLESRGLLR